RVAGVVSDAEGRFSIGPLRPGRWRLVARPQVSEPPDPEVSAVAPQAATAYTDVVAVAPATDLTLRLARGLTLFGELEGEDVAGFDVRWLLPPGPEGKRMGDVRVGKDGEFEIDGLPDAPLRLYARRIGDDRFALIEGMRPGPARQRILLTRG